MLMEVLPTSGAITHVARAKAPYASSVKASLARIGRGPDPIRTAVDSEIVMSSA
jgi:hypothetical protein